MAELFLDEEERRIIRNMTALISAAQNVPAVKTQASPASFRAKEEADKAIPVSAPVTPKEASPASVRAKEEADKAALVAAQPKGEALESPTLSVTKPLTTEEKIALKKYTRESNYFTKQSLLKGEKPTPPPADDDYTYDYTWHVFAGGGGEWRLIRFPKFKPTGSGNGNKDNGNNGNGNNGNGNNGNGSNDGTGDGSGTGKTTNIDVLKSLLRGMGFTSNLIDSSADFLNRLLKDGLDYDNAISIFLDSKEYTFKNGQKVTSPFYTAYGYLNEGLTIPKTASELFNSVEGFKGVVAKYSLSDKYLSSDSLKKYVKNNVSVSELDERANAARLKAINADKSYTDALQMLGYIKSPTDLTDFFLNPDIGKEKLEQNRSTAAFSAEAVRRAQQGIKFDATRFGEITAGLIGRGLSEEEIGVTAAKGFENIGEQLAPTTKLAQIYERMPATEAIDIQKELEAEQFLGTASQRRKRVKELEESSFKRAPGTTTSSLRTSRAGII